MAEYRIDPESWKHDTDWVISQIRNLDNEKSHSILIEPAGGRRSDAQNKLMWRWNKFISDHEGYDKDYVHGMMKHNELLPIYMSATTKKGEPKMAMQNKGMLVCDIIKHLPDLRLIYHVCDRELRTKTLTVGFFKEYLDRYEKSWIDKGVFLPNKNDDYYEAMGMRRVA